MTCSGVRCRRLGFESLVFPLHGRLDEAKEMYQLVSLDRSSKMTYRYTTDRKGNDSLTVTVDDTVDV